MKTINIEEEYVVCSAIWFKDFPLIKSDLIRMRGISPLNIDRGIVVCGLRHGNVIGIINALTSKRMAEVGESVQGFLTSKNIFLTREEAAELANKTGQTKDNKFLFSEDIY